MSEKVRRVDYAPDEYVSGVGGVLRADEQGIYWMVCTLIMSAGAPIPNNERRIASLCLVRPGYAKTVINKLVDMGKLHINDDGELYQNRALSEIERSSKRIQNAIENGAKGGRPRQIIQQDQGETKAPGYSPAKLTTTSTPTVEDRVSEEETLKSPKAAKRRVSYPPKFLEFWSQYPTDALMSKAAAGKAFIALSQEDQDAAINSIPAFKSYCSQHPDYRPVHAVRFLTQGRFEGFNKAAEKVNSKQFVAKGSREWEAIRLKRGVASLMEKDHRGTRGWWFEKSEIESAMMSQAA
jgi:uncharacterized protein YdaU (DUF1376 family)